MLRFSLVLSLALAPLLATSGCIPLGCGGYSGYGDSIIANGTDQLILCANHGFVVLASGSTTLEGFYTSNETDPPLSGPTYVGTDDPSSSGPIYVGTDGATGAVDFDLYGNAGTVTATIPQLAPGNWQWVYPDQAELDHYDWYCQQLTSQSWWSSGTNASRSDPNGTNAGGSAG